MLLFYFCSKMITEILLSVVVVEFAIIIIGFTYDSKPELSEEIRAKLYS